MVAAVWCATRQPNAATGRHLVPATAVERAKRRGSGCCLVCTPSSRSAGAAGGAGDPLPAPRPDSEPCEVKGDAVGWGDSNSAAVSKEECGCLRFGGQRLPVVSDFRNLSMVFSSSEMLVVSAAAGRCNAAQAALTEMHGRCATLKSPSTAAVHQPHGQQAVVRQRGVGTALDSPCSAERSGDAGSSSTPSWPEQLHLHLLRALLG